MNNKQQHIDYWKATAVDDLDTVDYLFEGRKYLQALFFTHLSLEKVLKAHWVNYNEANVPPKTHNLLQLYDRSGLELTEENTDFMQNMNAYQIEGRYPDYLTNLNSRIQREDTHKIISEAKILFQCLIELLP
jgi:HEPN domain-containing protein